MTKPEKLPLTSMDIADQRRQELKALFPTVFTETKGDDGQLVESIDFEKLKAELGTFSDVFESRRERYGMEWPGKKDCAKLLQEKSIGTLKPKAKSSVNFDSASNIFIEGDNLEVLKLLQKAYFGKVKLIYIDPPYNTGKEFIYPDNFQENLGTYLAYSGLVDDEGKKFSSNASTEGRFHTKWLNMMHPRLFLARNLLSDDGIMFISIDDGEVANLRKLCDELFGEENLIAQICHKSRASVSNDKIISSNHNHILLYAKSKAVVESQRKQFGLPPNLDGFDKSDERGEFKYAPVDGPGGGSKGNPHYEFMGVTGYFRFSKETMQKKFDEGRVVKVGNGLQQKMYKHESLDSRKTDTTWWDGKLYTSTATSQLKSLMGGDFFDNPKPVPLIQRMIQLWARNDGDIIMDFFAGSAATAHAVLAENAESEVKRRFIVVQLPEPIKEEAVLNKGFNTIADISAERVRKAIAQLPSGHSEGFRYFYLDQSNFRVWEGSSKDKTETGIAEQLSLHIDHLAPNASEEGILFEFLLKAGFVLSEHVDSLALASKRIYSVAEGSLLICLEDEITRELIDAVAEAEPMQFICLDRAFKGNDQLKANAVQTFAARNQGREKAEQIIFRTV